MARDEDIANVSEALHSCNGSPKIEVIRGCRACMSRRSVETKQPYRPMPAKFQNAMKAYNDDVDLPEIVNPRG